MKSLKKLRKKLQCNFTEVSLTLLRSAGVPDTWSPKLGTAQAISVNSFGVLECGQHLPEFAIPALRSKRLLPIPTPKQARKLYKILGFNYPSSTNDIAWRKIAVPLLDMACASRAVARSMAPRLLVEEAARDFQGYVADTVLPARQAAPVVKKPAAKKCCIKIEKKEIKKKITTKKPKNKV